MKKEFGFVLAAAILLAGCGQKKETTTTTARPVKTTIVESRSIIRKDFSGIVEAVEYVKLAFRVNGQIIQLPVIEGQKVKKGQLIAAIDPRDIALQYAATKSAYETAHKWAFESSKISMSCSRSTRGNSLLGRTTSYFIFDQVRGLVMID